MLAGAQRSGRTGDSASRLRSFRPFRLSHVCGRCLPAHAGQFDAAVAASATSAADSGFASSTSDRGGGGGAAAGGGAGGGAAAAAGCSAGVVPALTALAVAFAAAAATAAAAAAAAAAATTSADASLPVVATLRPEERSGARGAVPPERATPHAPACCAAAAKRPASSSAPVAHTCGCNSGAREWECGLNRGTVARLNEARRDRLLGIAVLIQYRARAVAAHLQRETCAVVSELCGGGGNSN